MYTDYTHRHHVKTMTELRIGDLAYASDLDHPILLLSCNDCTATNISPSGHISKYRARSMHSLSELLEVITHCTCKCFHLHGFPIGVPHV